MHRRDSFLLASHIKILVTQVSSRHNKYYFLKIATSLLRNIILYRMWSRSRLRIYSAATVRETYLETGASLCEKIHGVYRYLYARELAFHNQFPEATSTTTTAMTAWASYADRFLFYRHRPRELRFLCAPSKTPTAFPRLLHRNVYVRTAYIRFSRASVYISQFLFLSLRWHFDRVAIIVYSL